MSGFDFHIFCDKKGSLTLVICHHTLMFHNSPWSWGEQQLHFWLPWHFLSNQESPQGMKSSCSPFPEAHPSKRRRVSWQLPEAVMYPTLYLGSNRKSVFSKKKKGNCIMLYHSYEPRKGKMAVKLVASLQWWGKALVEVVVLGCPPVPTSSPHSTCWQQWWARSPAVKRPKSSAWHSSEGHSRAEGALRWHHVWGSEQSWGGKMDQVPKLQTPVLNMQFPGKGCIIQNILK